AGWWVGALLLVPAAVLSLRLALPSVQAALRLRRQLLTVIHPFYLVRSGAKSVTMWPLLRLVRVNLTRHSTNGVYTHTAVAARFGNETVNLSVRDEEYAKAWAQHLLDRRSELYHMMSQGLLEAAEGADFVPAAVVDRRNVQPWRAALTPAVLRQAT